MSIEPARHAHLLWFQTELPTLRTRIPHTLSTAARQRRRSDVASRSPTVVNTSIAIGSIAFGRPEACGPSYPARPLEPHGPTFRARPAGGPRTAAACSRRGPTQNPATPATISGARLGSCRGRPEQPSFTGPRATATRRSLAPRTGASVTHGCAASTSASRSAGPRCIRRRGPRVDGIKAIIAAVSGGCTATRACVGHAGLEKRDGAGTLPRSLNRGPGSR